MQNTANQDDNRRMRSARDARNQMMEPTGTETPPQKADPKQPGRPDRGELEQTKDATGQEENSAYQITQRDSNSSPKSYRNTRSP